MAKRWAAVLLIGCTPAPKPAAPKPAAPPRDEITITDAAMGKITGKTQSTLGPLRVALAGLDVKPIYDHGLELHVFKGGEQLFYVIPGDDGLVFNVHVTSPQVAVANHPWRAGKVFGDAKVLTKCECWGDQPMCFKEGEHIAVSFKRTCKPLSDAEADAHVRAVLDGVTIQRMVWSPRPFGVADEGGNNVQEP